MKRARPTKTPEPIPSTGIERASVQDRRGRTWTLSIVPIEEAEEENRRFWAAMTPEQRVEAVADCLLDSLKAKGRRGLPRFRRVYRVLERP